tara:strand:- start:310 stop:540 length:231 start_codon:yes stop_codon:yes gene_type:complete
MTITVNLNNDPVKIKTLQIGSLLIALKSEALNPGGLRFYRGSVVKRLKKYFPELPRTKMAAYNHLKKLGYYGDINA